MAKENKKNKKWEDILEGLLNNFSKLYSQHIKNNNTYIL